MAGRPQAWHGEMTGSEHGVGAERISATATGSASRSNRPPQATDRGGEIAKIVEGDEAPQVPLGGRIDGDLGDAGPVRQAERPAVALLVAFFDSGYRASGEEPEESAGCAAAIGTRAEGDGSRAP